MLWWAEIEWWTKFLRDIGIILGFPTIIFIGKYLYKSHIEALKAQISFLRETQYDRARDLLKAQKECFQEERDNLQELIKKLVIDPDGQATLIEAVGGSFRTVENKAEMTTLATSALGELIEIMEGKHTFEGKGEV